MLARLRKIFMRTRWRLKRGGCSEALKITVFLHRHSGATLEEITDHLCSCLPAESRRGFDECVARDLDLLQRYGVIVYRDGWRVSEEPDPFSTLVKTIDCEEAIVEAFGSLAIAYSGTIERRLASTIAAFVADECRSEDMRRFAYVYFLDVLGIPVRDWPSPLMDLPVPDGFDWSLLNVFLPKAQQRAA